MVVHKANSKMDYMNWPKLDHEKIKPTDEYV